MATRALASITCALRRTQLAVKQESPGHPRPGCGSITRCRTWPITRDWALLGGWSCTAVAHCNAVPLAADVPQACPCRHRHPHPPCRRACAQDRTAAALARQIASRAMWLLLVASGQVVVAVRHVRPWTTMVGCAQALLRPNVQEMPIAGGRPIEMLPYSVKHGIRACVFPLGWEAAER